MIPTYTEGQDPSVDESVWSSALKRIGGFFTSLGNEFLVALQAVNWKDNGTQPYQKTAHIVQVVNEDDSINGIDKDVTGREHRATIRNSQNGRVWAGRDSAIIEKGSDGYAVGQELNITNNGKRQPVLDQANSKYGRLGTGGGSQPATRYDYIPDQGTPMWDGGWSARQGAFTKGAPVWELLQKDSNVQLFAVYEDASMVLFGMNAIPEQQPDGSWLIRLRPVPPPQPQS